MKIAIGLSGGVDSSVAAYLLKKAGHDVFGLFMKNWEEKDQMGNCLYEKDYQDVVRICDVLDIPYYGINLSQAYWDLVFTRFLDDIKLGYTPNPDVLCNQKIKFNIFYQKALALGADALATGHYCQTKKGNLLKGADEKKDQSYFLYTIKKKVLKNVLFPIGDKIKTDVRALAQKAGLSVFNKRDSTGICFIGKRNFKTFLGNYIPQKMGYFQNLEGKVIGSHNGAFYYTIGQRKGMGIGGAGKAWFVAKKEINTNVVTLVQGGDHPALFSRELFATDLSWVQGGPPPLPYTCKAKIRYRQKEQSCTITSIEKGRAHVLFSEPMRAITPRQSIVFYQGAICVGGALIAQAGPSVWESTFCKKHSTTCF